MACCLWLVKTSKPVSYMRGRASIEETVLLHHILHMHMPQALNPSTTCLQMVVEGFGPVNRNEQVYMVQRC